MIPEGIPPNLYKVTMVLLIMFVGFAWPWRSEEEED